MNDNTQGLTDAEWREFQAIPEQGYSHRAWIDARIAERLAARGDAATQAIERVRAMADEWGKRAEKCRALADRPAITLRESHTYTQDAGIYADAARALRAALDAVPAPTQGTEPYEEPNQ